MSRGAVPGRPGLTATAGVVVVGSGSTAAIAAARSGAEVLLIDELPFMGGNSTAVLDTFYGFYTPGSRSLKIVGGLDAPAQWRNQVDDPARAYSFLDS